TPFPGTTIEGTHVVTQPLDGKSSFHKVDFMLSGSPDVEKRALMATAVKLWEDRVGFNLISGADDVFLREFSLIDVLIDTKNVVGLSAVVEVYSDITAAPILDRTNIGKTFDIPNYNPKEAAIMPPYGTTNGTALVISYFQNPWDDNHDILSATS